MVRDPSGFRLGGADHDLGFAQSMSAPLATLFDLTGRVGLLTEPLAFIPDSPSMPCSIPAIDE
jgi:hypothetical protein